MKNRLLKLFSFLVLALLFAVRVNAETTFAGDTINHEGEHDSTIFVAGNQVTDTSIVDGIKFVAGNKVDLSGKSPYAFYAGNVLTINANVEKDLFAAGNSLTIGSEAVLGRDVYLAGNTIKVNANVERNINVGCSSIDIKGIFIKGNAKLYCDELIMDENTTIEGKLVYPSTSIVKGLETAKIGSKEIIDVKEINTEVSFMDRVWNFIIRVFAGFVVLIALFRFIPSAKDRLDNIDLTFDTFAKRGCNGIIVLLVVPIISLFALVSGILTPISIITLLVYGICIYLSYLVIAYIIGRVLFIRVFKKNNIYLMMMCGILVLRLVQLVPIIGGFVSIISLFCGLGFIYKFITQKKK